jgi:arylamine N-acetyltransferase
VFLCVFVVKALFSGMMHQITRRFLNYYSVPHSTPNLSHLLRVAAAFSHLPYENVTKILKEACSAGSETKFRQPEEVLEDHVRWHTGGTCFSLSNTLQAVLLESGFPARIAMADMRYGSNIHCAVIVSAGEREYLLDPGYLLQEPISLPPLGSEIVHSTTMNTVIIRNEAPCFFSLYTIENGQTKWRYRLRTQPVAGNEFLKYWIHSFSLNTMENLMLSRLGPSGRIYFRKDRLEVVGRENRYRQKVSHSEWKELSSVFGLPASLIQEAQKILLSRV